jgi:hypothetical protein
MYARNNIPFLSQHAKYWLAVPLYRTPFELRLRIPAIVAHTYRQRKLERLTRQQTLAFVLIEVTYYTKTWKRLPYSVRSRLADWRWPS